MNLRILPHSELLTEILATARRNKLRTALTGFAVAWGIFMIIFLLGAGNGLIHAMETNSDRYLSNSMVVYGGQTSKAHAGMKEGRQVQLDDRDRELTADVYGDYIDNVGAELDHGNTTVCFGENYTSASIKGVFPNDRDINKREMACGRFVNDVDLRDRRKVLVMGSEMAKELCPQHPEELVGEYVKVGELAFMVVGIYQTDRSMMGTSAFIPFTTFRTIYNSGDKTGNIVFSFHGLQSIQDNELFEQQYRATLNAHHGAACDDEGSVWIWNRFTQNLKMSIGTSIVRTALWVIGLFTLLSGIVGVYNIMLITVKERTREFGIRKAIGATPWSILRLIITESIIITSFFGYIGMVAGVLANEYMDVTIGNMKVDSGMFTATMFVDPTVGIGVCVQSVLVMVIAGTVAGIIPARKAARIRPIEALRAE